MKITTLSSIKYDKPVIIFKRQKFQEFPKPVPTDEKEKSGNSKLDVVA